MHSVVVCIFRAAALHMNLPECSYSSTFSTRTKAGIAAQHSQVWAYIYVCACVYLFKAVTKAACASLSLCEPWIVWIFLPVDG